MSKEKKKEKSQEPKKAKTKKATAAAPAQAEPAAALPKAEATPAVVAEESPKPKARPKRPAAPRPKKEAAPVEVVISVEEISLRAYFISERRRHHGWPGDEHSDWVEAERQVREEKTKPKKKAVKKT